MGYHFEDKNMYKGKYDGCINMNHKIFDVKDSGIDYATFQKKHLVFHIFFLFPFLKCSNETVT